MIAYRLPEDSAIVKIMVDVMPPGTKVYFEPPPTDAVVPQPPVDYAMNAEPWEQVA
jgi:hypothetical protein